MMAVVEVARSAEPVYINEDLIVRAVDRGAMNELRSGRTRTAEWPVVVGDDGTERPLDPVDERGGVSPAQHKMLRLFRERLVALVGPLGEDLIWRMRIHAERPEDVAADYNRVRRFDDGSPWTGPAIRRELERALRTAREELPTEDVDRLASLSRWEE